MHKDLMQCDPGRYEMMTEANWNIREKHILINKSKLSITIKSDKKKIK